MKKRPTHNPGLWAELAAATCQGTESARWHALEKYCWNKLRQIAGKPPTSG
jgi:hypothetical protein